MGVLFSCLLATDIREGEEKTSLTKRKTSLTMSQSQPQTIQNIFRLVPTNRKTDWHSKRLCFKMGKGAGGRGSSQGLFTQVTPPQLRTTSAPRKRVRGMTQWPKDHGVKHPCLSLSTRQQSAPPQLNTTLKDVQSTRPPPVIHAGYLGVQVVRSRDGTRPLLWSSVLKERTVRGRQMDREENPPFTNRTFFSSLLNEWSVLFSSFFFPRPLAGDLS
ncbi:hypothetical protein BaRGS_00022649 [Batillaria attramentaria]|uniref:Ribosomal protein L2 n=1 Tax=Batillaria attramentaria TaxID=370345 RepID=A0ABD0KGG3_9CAEN